MRFPTQLKERGKVWKDFESSSLDLAAWFCATDGVSDQAVTWALPVTKDLVLLNSCCSSYMLCTFKGFAALPLFLMATSLSCKLLTAHLEQQMHSKACIGPIIRWTSEIYMCHGQNGGRLLPCAVFSHVWERSLFSMIFHIVAFVADERFTIFQWWNI